jgi:hypothetical protein
MAVKGLAWREGLQEGLAVEITWVRLSYRYTGCQALFWNECGERKIQKPHPSQKALPRFHGAAHCQPNQLEPNGAKFRQFTRDCPSAFGVSLELVLWIGV